MRCHSGAAAVVLLLGFQSATAQVVRQVTNLFRSTTTGAALDDAGTTAFAISDGDPYGTNPGHRLQIFSWDPASGVGSQVTSFPQGVDRDPYDAGPSVTDDGAKIAFLLDSRLALINADGTGLVQLTTQPATILHFQIAGNGSRVVFDSTANLTGQNPAGAPQVFAVEANGSGLRQLTSQVNVWLGVAWPTISDDGQRIAYLSSDGAVNGNLQLAGVLQDGTGSHFITSVASVNAGFLQISGNGQSVAFQNSGSLMEPGGCSGSSKIAIVEWNGTGLLPLDAPCLGASAPGGAGAPDITDDAQVVYYDAYDLDDYGSNVFKINRNGSGKVRITDCGAQPGPRARVDWAHVAGGGSRIAFRAEGGMPWGGPNPDLGVELYAATGTGTGTLQLTDLPSGDARAPAITPDATRIAFTSTQFSVAPPAYVVEQVFRSAPDGSGAVQLTSFADGTVADPQITDDGSKIVFTHQAPVASPVNESDEVFSVNADGTNLLSLTGTTSTGRSVAHLAGNGSVVVLVAHDLLNEGGITGNPVYRIHTDGTGAARVSPKTTSASHPRVDATGMWVVYQTGGATPQVHRQPVDGTVDQVIGVGDGSDGYTDVTPGGGLVVYNSNANPLGTNPDRNSELFLWEAATGTTRQLTVSASVLNTRPAFTRDGVWVYYWRGDANWDNLVPYRVNVVTATSQRVGGLSGCAFLRETSYYERFAPPSASTDASLVVFEVNGDCTGENRDGNHELFAIDGRVAPSIRISGGSDPTIVSWDVESGPTSYDVIRGDRASLAFRGDGSVDLGSVTCLENHSLDATTAQAPDAAIPAPGEVFFYLYRGAPGPVSYGVSSSGEARLPSSGDCSP